MQVSDSYQIYISEECSGCSVENTSVETVTAAQVRNGGSGDGRNRRFKIYVGSRINRT